MTLNDVKAIERDYLIPKEVASVLKCDQYLINVQVKQDKEKGINSFPFPTILIGNRVRIPRIAFIRAMEGTTDEVSEA